ncbi:Uncharacterised protein [Mycolicibacterium smegmatis]|nr:Uncharacterised protein [Mycolicibacterium smegmatis]
MTYPGGGQNSRSQQPPPYGGHPPYGAPQPAPIPHAPYGTASGYGTTPQYSSSPPPHYGAPGGHGYSGGPYGYGMPPQNSGKGGRGLLIGGGVLVVALLAVGVLFFVGGIGTSSDARAIEQIFADMAKTDGSLAATKQFFCAADQKRMQPVDTSILIDLGIEVPEASVDTSARGEISDINVDGDKATAKVTADGKTELNRPGFVGGS